MKKGLIEHIVCPECLTELSLIECGKYGIGGILRCANEHYYPVINDVPVLIKNNCLAHFLRPHELTGFISAAKELKIHPALGNIPDLQTELLKKSYVNWSMQWNTYDFEHTIWEDKKTFLEHIPLDESALGRYGALLEIGCGRGRNIKHVKRKDNTIFAIDISEAACITSERYRKDDNVYVLRSDAMHLPFKDGTFDLIYSDHVLQHIFDLNRCFAEIRRVARTDNAFFFNLYSKENNFIMTKAIEPFKKIVLNRLPIKLLHLLSSLPALCLWLSIKCVYAPVHKYAKKLYRILPLSEHMTFWLSFKYGICRQTCFDFLHAPIAYYFSNKDIEVLSAATALNLEDKHLLRETLWVCRGRFVKK